jgi:hypothetical protein
VHYYNTRCVSYKKKTIVRETVCIAPLPPGLAAQVVMSVNKGLGIRQVVLLTSRAQSALFVFPLLHAVNLAHTFYD